MPHKIILWIQWDNPCQTVIWTSKNVSYFYYGTKDLKVHSLLLRFLRICSRLWTIPFLPGSMEKIYKSHPATYPTFGSSHKRLCSPLADFLSPESCHSSKGPGARVGGEVGMAEWWGGSLHESHAVCTPGWAGRPVWDLTGTALENADGLQAHQTKRGEKERRERMPQAPELCQHIPAWWTLASGLCFWTRAGGEGIETGSMLFLTSTHFKLSFTDLDRGFSLSLGWLWILIGINHHH